MWVILILLLIPIVISWLVEVEDNPAVLSLENTIVLGIVLLLF